MREQTDGRDPIGKIAWHIAQDHYPTGHLAALRRLDPEQPEGAPFWWLVGHYLPAAFEDDHKAAALAATVRGMAVAHPFHRPSHGRRGMGEAMAEADVSEMRLLRLLRLQPAALPDELRRLARLMASKGDAGRFDWSDAFDLLWREDRQKVRLDIARSYYRKQFHLQQSQESAA